MNQKEIRAAFWESHPGADAEARQRRTRSKSQNYQAAWIRCSFVNFVDDLHRAGQITDNQAHRVTL